MNQRVAHINLDAINTLVVPTPKRLCLRVPLPGYVSVPVKYQLHHGGKSYEGFLDQQGGCDVQLAQASGDASFQVWPYGEQVEPVEWQLALGVLADGETLQGVQARLNNLGFNAGPVDGVMGRLTRAALIRFQEKHQLKTSGEADQNTKAALLDAYGS